MDTRIWVFKLNQEILHKEIDLLAKVMTDKIKSK